MLRLYYFIEDASYYKMVSPLQLIRLLASRSCNITFDTHKYTFQPRRSFKTGHWNLTENWWKLWKIMINVVSSYILNLLQRGKKSCGIGLTYFYYLFLFLNREIIFLWLFSSFLRFCENPGKKNVRSTACQVKEISIYHI